MKPAQDQKFEGILPARYDLRFAFASAWPWAARPEGEGGEGSGTGEGTSGSGEGEGSGSSGDAGAGTGDDKEKEGVKDPDKKRLSDEAAQHRNRAKAAEKERDEALTKLRELEDKDKTESEKNKRDAEEAKAKAAKAEAKLKEQAVKLAFFDCGAAALFHDAGDALSLLEKMEGFKDIKPDDEGVVEGKAIRTLADDLLKQKPYLAKREGDDQGSSSGGLGGDTASGRPNNSKKSKDQVDYEALAKKFPALRR
jgi:hypothetical protein